MLDFLHLFIFVKVDVNYFQYIFLNLITSICLQFVFLNFSEWPCFFYFSYHDWPATILNE